jgi:hypothetical protein
MLYLGKGRTSLPNLIVHNLQQNYSITPVKYFGLHFKIKKEMVTFTT